MASRDVVCLVALAVRVAAADLMTLPPPVPLMPLPTLPPPMTLPPLVTVPLTSFAPFDCQAGYANWEEGWARGKKAWCCEHEKSGCPKSAATSKPYDCQAGYPNDVGAWPADKQEWCCKHGGFGCSTTTSRPYDCKAGYSHWEKGWSSSKKAWCCEHEGSGCTTTPTTTSLPFDCKAGFSNWRKGWSDDKKAWCCKREGSGCPPTTTPLYDCASGYSNWARGWSSIKKAWCCEHEAKGCTTTATSSTATTSTVTTSTSTSTTNGCKNVCTFNGKAQTCVSRIQWSAVHDFLGEPNACEAAHSMVVQQCAACSTCPAPAAGCGILEPKKTPVFSTTTPAPAPGCDNVCIYSGQSATCRSRMQWAAKHLLFPKSHACKSAHSLVLRQCPSCSGCPIEALGCSVGSAPPPPPPPKPLTNAIFKFEPVPADAPAAPRRPIARWAPTSRVLAVLAVTAAASCAGLVVAIAARRRRTRAAAAGRGGAQTYADVWLARPGPAASLE